MALEKRRRAWNQRVRGVFDFSNIVPLSGAISFLHLPQRKLFLPGLNEYTPLQVHLLPCNELKMNSRQILLWGKLFKSSLIPNLEVRDIATFYQLGGVYGDTSLQLPSLYMAYLCAPITYFFLYHYRGSSLSFMTFFLKRVTTTCNCLIRRRFAVWIRRASSS